MSNPYSPSAPTRAEVEALEGPVVLDFGTEWCGHCRRAQPLIAEALQAHPDVRHIKVEDGSGRRLGRLYGVRLWPTLIFLSDGREAARLVRPGDVASIRAAVEEITR